MVWAKLWLGPEVREALERLKGEHGSKDAAAEAAIRAFAERVAVQQTGQSGAVSGAET